MNKPYPRDLIGYGADVPHAAWPGGAKIALQFVINYEEGGENCVLHGDRASEQFLSEIVGAAAFEARHQSMETLYEYGSRAGFWRLHRLFTSEQVPVTVFGVAMAMERNPAAVDAMLEADWEICSHGYRWISYQDVPIDIEREHMQKAIDIQTRLTGQRPLGWYTGRTSPNTLALVAEEGGFLYCADSYADDLPYWDNHYSKPLLMVPYTLDTNDMRFATPQGFNSGDQFFSYLKDAFDVLYQEGEVAPKMLSIGIHCRLLGRPARLAALKRFIHYAKSHDAVWFAKREAIAQHWANRFPFS
ncbi:allantoinase PuuE [Pseudomaricurvus alkylphenolicus]|uniref:allantoinase PuuE n=1 Tax=Pseudomaricurvus alkylphenolicus TaxID=1306991 RepID=UPI00141F439C|nr:allantoinase PuuE [Pseudomaricurvus alkylphenolicus]NIB41438.1 allantoinase PuuE [Pseudomaricurvus alkylphenolicus]